MSLIPHNELIRQIVRRPQWKRYYAALCKNIEDLGAQPPSQVAVICEMIGQADDVEVAAMEASEATQQ